MSITNVFRITTGGGSSFDLPAEYVFISGDLTLDSNDEYRNINEQIKLDYNTAPVLYNHYSLNPKGYENEYTISNEYGKFGIDFTNFLVKTIEIKENIFLRFDGNNCYISLTYNFEEELLLTNMFTMLNLIGDLGNGFLFGDSNTGQFHYFQLPNSYTDLQDLHDNIVHHDFSANPDGLSYSTNYIKEAFSCKEDVIYFPVTEDRLNIVELKLNNNAGEYVKQFSLPVDLFDGQNYIVTKNGLFYTTGKLYDPQQDIRTNMAYVQYNNFSTMTYFYKDGKDYFSVQDPDGNYGFHIVTSIIDYYQFDAMASPIHNFSGDNEFTRDYIAGPISDGAVSSQNVVTKYNNGTFIDAVLQAGISSEVGNVYLIGWNLFDQEKISKISTFSKRHSSRLLGTSDSAAIYFDTGITDSSVFYIQGLGKPGVDKNYYIKVE